MNVGPRAMDPQATSSSSSAPAPQGAAGIVPPPPAAKWPDPPERGFASDFRRLFVRGLAALLPTLITLSVIFWVWNFLWESLGRQIIWLIRYAWFTLAERGILAPTSAGHIYLSLSDERMSTKVIGVVLAVILVYIVGF